VREGLDDGDPAPEVPSPAKRAEERALLERRRAREARLRAWRRQRARERGVDEQAVLPGHCLSDVAALREATREALAAVPGLGRGRLERDGEALLALVREGDGDAELSARARR
jgi:ribonuclease D